MKIIRKEPNPSGAYPQINESNFRSLPEGHAVVPEEFDSRVFYEYSGFVTLTWDEHDVVTAMEPNLEAWEAWKEWEAAQEPVEPEGPEEDVTTADMAAAIREGVDGV